jgi:hypothetical protein
MWFKGWDLSKSSGGQEKYTAKSRYREMPWSSGGVGEWFRAARDTDNNFSKHISMAVILPFHIILRLYIPVYQMTA